ncbi:MAG: flagellar motor protein [Bdellovibrionales bacterium]|nr:flagellar motor protein [Bdellovibrionales bacterium]
MQITTIFGLLIGIGGILIGNLLEGGSTGSLMQATAALIVFGGTFGAVIVSNRKEDLRMALGALRQVFGGSETSERNLVAKEIIQSAQLARRESLLALEKQVGKFRDPFMRTVYRFAIDGVDPEVLRRIFEEEIAVNERRKMAAAKVWGDAGGFAPTIGIIGAVLGLISVMANITDTSMLGQGIAVAFVATIYGVGSANLVFIPISNKLKTLIRFRSETERMVLEGALAVVNGLNPYLIEQKMRAFTAEVQAS